MALSTYTELKAAVRTEINKTTAGLPDAVIVDAVTRAEAKMNRLLRVRAMESLTTDTLLPGTRFMAFPTGMLELVALHAKAASAADSAYELLKPVAAASISAYYSDTSRLVYTVRNQFEFNREVSAAHTMRMHYYKRLDIAADATNDVLTYYPDVYLYGALAECELHVRDDARMGLWRGLFMEAIAEMNELDERTRDDAELDTSELACMASTNHFNILTGG